MKLSLKNVILFWTVHVSLLLTNQTRLNDFIVLFAQHFLASCGTPDGGSEIEVQPERTLTSLKPQARD